MRRWVAFSLLLVCMRAEALDCSRPAGSLPDSSVPAGTANAAVPIEHIVVIMQENRSFDTYFGSLNVTGYEGQIDGIRPNMSNRARRGDNVRVYHAKNLCTPDINHSWNAMHALSNGGRNDQFVINNGKTSMQYYDKTDLPYYYGLANQFAVADRFFASAMTQTYPNRLFLYAASSFGHIRNDESPSYSEFKQKTIFDVLDANHITWKYYQTEEDYLKLFAPLHARDQRKIAKADQFRVDVAAKKLPQVAFVESSERGKQDEHPPSNIQIGQTWVADKIDALLASDYWANSVLFLVYDENGGYYDHVPSPEACLPDGVAPALGPGNAPGGFDHYGFRVPFIAISPYAKHHFVSHVTYDHTSILKFIETKYNLPALTRRDANADGLMDMFDFSHQEVKVLKLPSSKMDPKRALFCRRHPNGA